MTVATQFALIDVYRSMVDTANCAANIDKVDGVNTHKFMTGDPVIHSGKMR
jgi:hypothetical protein